MNYLGSLVATRLPRPEYLVRGCGENNRGVYSSIEASQPALEYAEVVGFWAVLVAVRRVRLDLEISFICTMSSQLKQSR